MTPIDAASFKQATGHDPKNDDLERSNCPEAGKPGHWGCGWNHEASLPVFMTGQLNIKPEQAGEAIDPGANHASVPTMRPCPFDPRPAERLRSALEELTAGAADNGVFFENGVSEGCYLEQDIKHALNFMDQGVSVDAVLEFLVSQHAPLHTDGSDAYGFAPVRQAVYKAGSGRRFDELVTQSRQLARQGHEQAGRPASVLRRMFPRR